MLCFLLTQFSSLYCTCTVAASLYDHNRKRRLSDTKIVRNKRFNARKSITKSQGLGTSGIGLKQECLHEIFTKMRIFGKMCQFGQNERIFTILSVQNFLYLCSESVWDIFQTFSSFVNFFASDFCENAKMDLECENEDFCFILVLRQTLRTFKT